MNGSESNDAIRARLDAEANSIGSTCRVLAVRLDGALDELCGRTGDRAAPTSLAAFRARAESIESLVSDAVSRLAQAGAIATSACFRAGIDRAWLIARSDSATDARLTEARASLEAECLSRWQGARSIVIAWVDVEATALHAESTASSLAERLARRARTPFLDALGGESPCGPFAATEATRAESGESIAGAVAACVIRDARGAVADLAASIAGSDHGPIASKSSGRLVVASLADATVVAGSLLDVLECAVTHGEARVTVAIEAARSENGLGGALARARARVPSGVSMLGVRVPLERLSAALALGRDLVPLARQNPSALRGLLEVAVEIDEGMDRAPLMLLSRWRARAHAIAANLGVDERAIRDNPEGSRAAEREGALDLERPERRALKSLIREFPRWFDTGAARIPLWCALIEAETTAEVCSA